MRFRKRSPVRLWMTQSGSKQPWEEAWLQAPCESLQGVISTQPASLFPKAQEDLGPRPAPWWPCWLSSVPAAFCLCCGAPMGVPARQGPVPSRRTAGRGSPEGPSPAHTSRPSLAGRAGRSPWATIGPHEISHCTPPGPAGPPKLACSPLLVPKVWVKH